MLGAGTGSGCVGKGEGGGGGEGGACALTSKENSMRHEETSLKGERLRYMIVRPNESWFSLESSSSMVRTPRTLSRPSVLPTSDQRPASFCDSFSVTVDQMKCSSAQRTALCPAPKPVLYSSIANSTDSTKFA